MGLLPKLLVGASGVFLGGGAICPFDGPFRATVPDAVGGAGGPRTLVGLDIGAALLPGGVVFPFTPPGICGGSRLMDDPEKPTQLNHS